MSARKLVSQFFDAELPIFEVLVPYIEMILSENTMYGYGIAVYVLTTILSARIENTYDQLMPPLGLSGGPALELLSGAVAMGSLSLSGEQKIIDGKDGFLWKPVSESTGKLVVLTKGESEAKIYKAIEEPIGSGTYIKSEFVESGVFSSIANGGRHHYRFSKPGSGYGPDPVYFDDILIIDPSIRND